MKWMGFALLLAGCSSSGSYTPISSGGVVETQRATQNQWILNQQRIDQQAQEANREWQRRQK
jgi:hypothetical protein